MSHIFHIAERSTWETVTPATPYTMSTVGTTLAEQGFIHACSTDDQVTGVLSRYYQGATDLVLLVIDPRHLDVRFEPALVDGEEHLFPHIYEALPLKDVIEVRSIPDNR
ncbi:MAG: DUF952 domain-containing protein [Streptosporangiaceae bacterium]